MAKSVRDRLEQIYLRLLDAYGPQGWWPGDGEFETVLGAYLTQNTTWRNAAMAIENLKGKIPLEPAAMRGLDLDTLRECIRPAGYYNQKAKKIVFFLEHLSEHYADDIHQMLAKPVGTLRPELLNLWGVGPETADSILCYAAHQPVFVVDKYTIRMLSRHGLVPEDATYDEVQALVHRFLPRDTSMYNELHALIVRVCVAQCRVKPACGECPLEPFLTRAQRLRIEKTRAQ